MTRIEKKDIKKILPAILFLFAGIGIGISNFRGDCNLTGLTYINIDLGCENKYAVGKQSYASFRNILKDFIEEKKANKEVSEVSIYFRDLQNGPTLGINEHTLFSPASLLKLPLLLTYENVKNDQFSDLFERKIIAKQPTIDVPNQRIVAKESVEYGKIYSINELLNNMVKYSDNKSYYVLLEYLRTISPEKDLLKQTFIDLGIIDPKDLLDNTISVKSYGSIFVQLYNSSYFNKQETSNEALSMLSEVDWKNGINAGVPATIKVAHKFGERFGFAGDTVQLHDCGIVYYPKNPYLLCIMTRGTDFSTLEKTISEISKMFYEEFDSRKL